MGTYERLQVREFSDKGPRYEVTLWRWQQTAAVGSGDTIPAALTQMADAIEYAREHGLREHERVSRDGHIVRAAYCALWLGD